MKDGTTDMTTRKYNKVAFDVAEGKIYNLETKKAAQVRVKSDRVKVKHAPSKGVVHFDAYLNRRKS